MSPRPKSAVIEEYRLQQIRDAALRVFAERGIADATMQQIADEAQIAKGTLYLYFKDRDKLVESVGDLVLDGIREAVDRAFEAKVTFAEKLRLVIQTQFEYFDENREFILVLKETIERSRGDARQQRDCDPHYQHYLDQLKAMLRKAMTRGDIRRCDPETLSVFIAEGTIALILRRISDPKLRPVEPDVSVIVNTLLGGLEPRKEG